MLDFFISHSTADDKRADDLMNALKPHDLTVWIDHQNGIAPGNPNWDGAIRAAIKDCRAGLFLMSPRSLKSEICQAECLTIKELGKPLYVAYIETYEKGEVWLFIKMIQYADLRTDFAAGAASIARAFLGKSTAGDPTPIHSAGITGGEVMRINLPYLNTMKLTGRDDDVSALRDLLGKGGVVQVTAVGGMGKSRIAAEIARSDDHGRGAIWHRCEKDSAPYQITDLIRTHYGLDDKANEDTVIAALDSAPPLIVIDNGEEVEAKTDRRSAYVALINRITAHSAPVLLTSRVMWDEIKPRIVHPLDPITLDQAAQVTLDFAVPERVTLTPDEARALAQKSHLHPRLIEFAVRQVQERGLAAVLRQLDELKHHEIQDALDEMIHKSVRQMSAATKGGADAEALLKRLTVCRGTFDRAAVTALTPETLTADQADDALVLLARWGFVRRDGTANRYRMDEIVTTALPPAEDALTAHYAYFERLHGDYDANNNADRHPLIEADWANVRAALTWGLANQPEAAVAFTWALHYFMGLRVSRAEWRTVIDAAYQTAERGGDQRRQANMLYALGEVARMTNEYARAREYYGRALPVYEAIGARLGAAHTLKALGEVARMTNEYARAREYYGRALPVYEAIGDRLGAANTLKALGDVALQTNEYASAREYYGRALPVYEAIGDRLGAAHTLKALGDVARMTNEYASAREYYGRALPVYEAIGDRLGAAHTLKVLGEVARMTNEYARAREYYGRALPVYEAIGDRLGAANTLQVLGEVARMTNEYARAREYYGRALALGEQIGDFTARLNSLNGLARLETAEGSHDAACAAYRRLLALADSHPFFKSHPVVESWRGEYAALGCGE